MGFAVSGIGAVTALFDATLVLTESEEGLHAVSPALGHDDVVLAGAASVFGPAGICKSRLAWDNVAEAVNETLDGAASTSVLSEGRRAAQRCGSSDYGGEIRSLG